MCSSLLCNNSINQNTNYYLSLYYSLAEYIYLLVSFIQQMDSCPLLSSNEMEEKDWKTLSNEVCTACLSILYVCLFPSIYQ